MKNTDKYGFIKPESSDFYNIEHQNENWEKLDGILGTAGKDNVVDNLESTATDLPLSANQGRILNEALAHGCVKFQVVDGELQYSVYTED